MMKSSQGTLEPALTKYPPASAARGLAGRSYERLKSAPGMMSGCASLQSMWKCPRAPGSFVGGILAVSGCVSSGLHVCLEGLLQRQVLERTRGPCGSQGEASSTGPAHQLAPSHCSRRSESGDKCPRHCLFVISI